jgi:hypothetical protein
MSQSSDFKFKGWSGSMVHNVEKNLPTMNFTASEYGNQIAGFQEIPPLKFDFLFGIIGVLAAVPVLKGFPIIGYT